MQIQIKNVTKKYGTFYGLKDFSTTIEEGKITGLLGPNGAGKSTFLRMLTQIYEPTSGQILIGREELSSEHRSLFGYLPEDKGLYQDVNLLDQLIYFGKIKGMSGEDAKKEALNWLEKFELTSHLKSKVNKLSKGMQQKVQFMASIIHSPKIVVLDEPLSGLDPVNGKVIDEYIKESKELGRTVIFSTHRMEQAEGIADNILIINKGKKVLDGETAKIKQEYFDNSYSLKFEDYAKTLNFLKKQNGVEIVETDKEKEDFKIRLESGKINEFVKELCEISGFRSVRELEPTIGEIFLQLINNS